MRGFLRLKFIIKQRGFHLFYDKKLLKVSTESLRKQVAWGVKKNPEFNADLRSKAIIQEKCIGKKLDPKKYFLEILIFLKQFFEIILFQYAFLMIPSDVRSS